MAQKDQNEKLDEEKLGKIVRMAKLGTGGEKANAIRIIKGICKKYDLIFDDVMNNIDVKEFEISYRTNDDKDVLLYTIYRYGMLKFEDSVWNRYPRKLGFKTTTEKHIEVLNAYSVLRTLYKKEKAKAQEAFSLAFRTKHNLYYQPTDEEWKVIEKKRKKEKQKERDKSIDMMAQGMSMGMESAEIHKQLK